MMDGIDANRKKWQDLCSSYQQTRSASVSNQSTESGQNTESGEEDGENNENLESRETAKPVENSVFGSKCS